METHKHIQIIKECDFLRLNSHVPRAKFTNRKQLGLKCKNQVPLRTEITIHMLTYKKKIIGAESLERDLTNHSISVYAKKLVILTTTYKFVIGLHPPTPQTKNT